jgi:hypothetical protein
MVADSLLRALPKASPFRDESSYTLAKELARVGRLPKRARASKRCGKESGDGYWSIRARETIGAERCAFAATAPAGSDSTWSALESGSLAAHSADPALQRAAVLARWGLQDDAENEIAILRRELSSMCRDCARSPPRPKAWEFREQGWPRPAGALALGRLDPFPDDPRIFRATHFSLGARRASAALERRVRRRSVLRDGGDARGELARSGSGLARRCPRTFADHAGNGTGLGAAERTARFPTRRSLRSAINIRLGVFYLRRLFDRLGNEPLLVLAAYNAEKRMPNVEGRCRGELRR